MNTSYKLKAALIFFLFCLLYSIIAGNLYILQIKKHTFFSQMGRQQYHVTMSQFSTRAEIFDRTHQPLAINNDYLSAFIIPTQLKEPEKTKAFLAKHFPHAYTKLSTGKEKNFMYLQRRLNQEQVDTINAAHIIDIKFLKERGRFYPITAAASVVGTTDIDNKGICGIELQYNKHIGGTPSIDSLEQDARSGHFYFKKETSHEGIPGQPLTLTIDGTLQFLVADELQDTLTTWQAQEGAAIVMDPKTGQIFAMVTVPSFDPNDPAHLDLALTKNKVATECYEFGSIAKAFTALAALEEHVVTIDEKFDCKNSKTAYVGGRRVNTLTPHGVLTFSEVIELSNNIGTALVAIRLGPKLYNHFVRLGFGKKTSLHFPGEQPGFVNPPTHWSKQSVISMSYGYEITCSLLQIARAFSLIARNGCPVEPKLVLDEISKQEQKTAPLYSQQTIDLLKGILEKTTQEGTTKRAAIKGYRIMSKSGTANLLINGQYSPSNNIYTCAGILEKDNYQRVIVAFVREAKKDNAFAATVAAPLFGRIAEKTVIHDKIIETV
jgi:cell division protein FtsI (penicillin-binding protein 3)